MGVTGDSLLNGTVLVYFLRVIVSTLKIRTEYVDYLSYTEGWRRRPNA